MKSTQGQRQGWLSWVCKCVGGAYETKNGQKRLSLEMAGCHEGVLEIYRCLEVTLEIDRCLKVALEIDRSSTRD
jgi:hypothetical protein